MIRYWRCDRQWTEQKAPERGISLAQALVLDLVFIVMPVVVLIVGVIG